MGGVSRMRDSGAYMKVAMPAASVDVDAAGTINGAGIDRRGFESCTLFASTGDIAGSPTATTVDIKLQDSADNSTFADLTGAALTQITAADTLEQKDIDLSGAKRYIRIVRVVAFTGGISPTVDVGVGVVLAGAVDIPA